ncbi:MAG: glutaredoxin [Verrucomicrobia bacterium]|nr:glutaredoxin [Verrucomicrobiota bacterium]
MSHPAPKIVIYLKTFCGWSQGVRAVMRKYALKYEEKDIIKDPALRWEMEQRTGQPLSPCIEIDGHMLVDVSGEEVEKWLIQNEYVGQSEAAPVVPISSPRVRGEAAQPRPKSLGKARPASKVEKIRFFD